MPKERIGIMGGSFNPIHDRHIQMAVCAMQEFNLEQILFLPTGNPPHKKLGLASAEDRFEMTRLAIFGMDHFIASRTEMDREGIVYTVDTLSRLQKQYPDTSFDYIIGEDAMMELPNWKKPEKLFSMCRFLVCSRSTEGLKDHPAVKALEKQGAELAFLSMQPSHLSSSVIRNELSHSDKAEGLPPQVEEYIRLVGLYGKKSYVSDGRQLYGQLKSVLSEKRLFHSILVAATCRDLARLHGIDPDQAALAGLMHDCAKCLPLTTMQKIARDNRLLLDKETMQNGNLLHGPVGAAVAEEEYHISDPMILSAIRCHTTGKVGMLPLDMIVYLADKIEPSRRSYPVLEKVRTLAKVDLAAAMRYSLESTLDYVRSQHTQPHPLTQQAFDWLKRISKS